MTTMTYTEVLTVVHCTCGMAYAIPQTLDKQLLDHAGRKSIYCPLGHQWHYLGKSAEERIREAERRTRAARDLLHAEERSHAATRGHLTRTKQRVAAGVCPCCGRTFQQLARHMANKHPDYVKES